MTRLGRGNGGGGRGKHHNSDNTSKYVIIGLGVVAAAFLIWFFSQAEDKHRIDDVQDVTVADVENGNTIILKNGLKVNLLGVDNTSNAKQFLLDNVKGKSVTLRSDSRDVNPTYIDASKSTVRAYVNLKGTSYNNLNGYMLNQQLSALNSGYCSDSLEAYKQYASKYVAVEEQTDKTGGNRVLLSKIDLGKKMTPASFLILGEAANGVVVGTGFFINERGLAITNYHVLNYDANFTIYLTKDNGDIYLANGHPFGRVLKANKKDDWAIFTVTLDNGEKVPYLPITSTSPERGEDVAAVGNPSMQNNIYTSTFVSGGTITALRPENNEIQIDLNLTHGNSGGPICNMYGAVVGIVKSVALDDNGNQNVANVNFGVDIEVVKKALNALKETEKVDIAEYYTL